jgi:GntR family transcriptional regulator, transcriptional repressor for pyruvate dehydrogenase complex
MTAEGTPVAKGGGFVEPVATERTFEQAIDRIIEGIERSRLRSGDRLPNEAELAEQLGISKPTLRQALRVLERAGLVEVRRGGKGGIFLAGDLIPVDLLRSQVVAEEQHVVETLVGRRVIEGGVTRVAALVATEEDFAEIERTVELLAANTGSRPSVMRADAAFHRAVSRASHNRTMQAAMRLLAKELAPIRDAYPGGPEDDKLTLDIHRRQLEAMRRRDLDLLDEVLDQHFSQLEDLFARAVGASREELFGAAGVSPRNLPIDR